MDRVAFTIPGEPIGKGRPRFGNGRTYTPARTRAYEAAIASAAQTAVYRAGIAPFRGACAVEVVAAMRERQLDAAETAEPASAPKVAA